MKTPAKATYPTYVPLKIMSQIVFSQYKNIAITAGSDGFTQALHIL